ncbi:transcriptional regulator [Fontivita pretiosa]|uniref:transcriptional regulator n=1 Tax=Fontivita pretiosa TaxID=2989684 RepID=UPI003D1860A3
MPIDSLDALITNPARLRILTALVADPKQEFVRLRGATRMTDGNLASHARRLHRAGLLAIDKSFRDGKPVTTFTLTEQGRAALHAHVAELLSALQIDASSAMTYSRGRQPADNRETQPPMDAAPVAGSGDSLRTFAESDQSDWID